MQLHPWRRLLPIEIAPLVEWLAKGEFAWTQPVSPTKPQRVFLPPADLISRAVNDTLLLISPDAVVHLPMLSRMRPGQSHPLHVDIQLSNWITRVHVPLITNPGAWMLFEGGERVHFEAGWSYSFDALHRHAFGNDGAADRVHLIFDVLRADP